MSICFGNRKSKSPGPITMAFVLLACVIVGSNLAPVRSAMDWLGLSAVKSFAAKRDSGVNRANQDPTNAALIDAIVSIVQTYYVDGERVDNQHLIGGTMRTLAYAIADLRYEESETEMTLNVKGESLTFTRSTQTSYDELLSQLKALTGFCAKTGVADLLTNASMGLVGGEKNASTIVLNAMLSSLDAHSSLMSPESYKELRQGTEGSFGGLGVLVGVKDHLLTVLKPMPRSPAQRVGIRRNDRIVSIDGFPTFGLSLDQLVGHMRGDPGTSAMLSILRHDSTAPWMVAVPREIIEVDSVEVKPKHVGDLHYLHLVIDSFASRTSKEVLDAVKAFRRLYPLHGVVLDMRSNPGGLLDQAIAVSDIFLRSGVIVSTQGRRNELERATSGHDELDFPVVVMMNEDSASASEIVAGALQDNGRAIVVGQPSFGKGSVQTLFELPEDRALKLTIARYYTPSNRSIQNVGIMPDVWTQPVYKQAENLNLFGPYRYRNEAFLPNHLSSSANQRTLGDAPILKGYYLNDPQLKQSDDDLSHDVELAVAEAILARSHRVYGDRLPEGARRASHLLAVSMPDLRALLAQRTAATTAWMKEKLKVEWSGDGATHAKIPLQLSVKDGTLQGQTGGKVAVPWRIANVSTMAVKNVSLFIQAPVAGIETQEFVVGTLEAGAVKEGTAWMNLSPGLVIGRHRVTVGVAVDAVASEQSVGEFTLDVNEGSFAELEISSEFRDGAGSKEAEMLDQDEQGIVRLRIRNKSNVPARSLTIALSSLSGRQLQLKQAKWEIPAIQPSQVVEMDVPVHGGSRIVNGLLTVGAVVVSKDIRGPLAKMFDVKAASRLTAAREQGPVSH